MAATQYSPPKNPSPRYLENVAWIKAFYAAITEGLSGAEAVAIADSHVVCPRCGGMGWVPSNTEADTDPCPKCQGGFKQ
jgi:hypothetical protein